MGGLTFAYGVGVLLTAVKDSATDPYEALLEFAFGLALVAVPAGLVLIQRQLTGFESSHATTRS